MADEPIDISVEAVQAAVNAYQADKKLVTLETGIVLRAKAVPRGIMQRVVQQIPTPAVPRFELPDGTFEDNPADPDYNAALAKMHDDRLNATFTAMFTLGTTVESIPDGMFGPDDDGWVEQAAVFVNDPPAPRTNSVARYRDWLDMYAVTTSTDRAALYAAVLAATGIMEPEVQAAVAYFRRAAQRDPITGLPASEPSRLGDSLPDAPTGPRTGD